MKKRITAVYLSLILILTSLYSTPGEVKAEAIAKTDIAQERLSTSENQVEEKKNEVLSTSENQVVDVCKESLLPFSVTEVENETGTQGNIYTERCVSVIPNIHWTPSYGWTTEGKWVDLSDNEQANGKLISNAPLDYIPVQAGETYVITTNRIYWIYDKGTHVLFTDDKMNPINCGEIDNTQNLSDAVIHVPDGATKMYITYYCNQTFRLDKILESTTNQDAQSLARSESELVFDAVLKQQTADKEFAYKFDKAKITFVLDDVRGDVNFVYDIFKEYGFQNICIAAIPGHMYQIAQGGKAIRKDTLDEIVEKGGEILAHYGDQLTKETYTKTQIRKRFKETKEELESFGYDVNGIILAGGVGFASIDFEDVEKWSRYYYDYSDLYGVHEPYRRGRASFAYAYTTQARFEEAINSTIDKKGWMILYMHDLNEMPEDNLRERLAYVKARVEEGSVDIATYKKINDDYGIQNNGTTQGEYGGVDYLVREDMDGYLAYSDQKKIENGVNEYYSQRLLKDQSVNCQDVYVSSSVGDDNNVGTIEAPKKTLEGLSKVNNLHIYLKSGDTFLLTNSFQFGNNVSINSYNEAGEIGVGKRPVINGWDTLQGSWNETDVDNVWELDFSQNSRLVTSGKLNGNIGMLKINGSVNFERYVFGAEVEPTEYAQRIAQLKQQILVNEGTFIPFWTVDTENSKIYLYSGVNPNEEEILYAAPYFGISMGNASNVGLNHVEITGFSKHAVSMSNTHKANVTDCYIHHIGGGLLNEGNPVRYGNAVEVWSNGTDIYVGENIANWIFDTAYTNQTTGSNITQENILFERNIANRCFWGLESWGDNCNPEGFKNITYQNNVIMNVCDITRPDVECYYGNSFTNYNGNGEAMDGKKPYISCRSGEYYFSQMSGISAAISNDNTSLTFSRNAVLFSNRYTAILSTTASGKYPTMTGNLMYSSVPNNNCNLIRTKTPKDVFFSFCEQLPGEQNSVIAEHGAQLLSYSDALAETSKYVEQCYEYPIVRITSIVFDVDKKLFEIGTILDCNVKTAKFKNNDGSTVDIAASDYVFDTSAVDINKAGLYVVTLTATNPENGQQLRGEVTVEVSSDLSLFVWDEGTADEGKTKWSIRKNGDLYIEAGSEKNGGMAQYANASDTPWYAYSNKIEKVYINQPYHYASNFFDRTAAVKKVYINSNITGNLNLGETPNLEDIVIGKEVTVNSIGLNGKSKITSYDFSKIKGELNGLQVIKDTALEEAIFYTMPGNNSAIYRNPDLTSITILNPPESKSGLKDAYINVNGWNKSDGVRQLYVGWKKDEVANAPWGLKGDFTLSYVDCDTIYVAGVEQRTQEHEFSSYVSDKTVSCTQDGLLVSTCKVCGRRDSIVEDKLGHDYINGICSRCGKNNGLPDFPGGNGDEDIPPVSPTPLQKPSLSQKDNDATLVYKESPKLSKEKIILAVGEKYTLNVVNEKIKEPMKITWKSSNQKIVKVNSKGVITGKKKGKATITAMTIDGTTMTCVVTVKKAPRELKINKTEVTMKSGQKFKIKYSIPKGTYTKVTYKSSNKNVVKVNAKGVCTGLKKGRATVSVVTSNGIKKKCKITILDAAGASAN